MVVLGTGKTYYLLCKKSSIANALQGPKFISIFHQSAACSVMTLRTEEEKASVITIYL